MHISSEIRVISLSVRVMFKQSMWQDKSMLRVASAVSRSRLGRSGLLCRCRTGGFCRQHRQDDNEYRYQEQHANSKMIFCPVFHFILTINIYLETQFSILLRSPSADRSWLLATPLFAVTGQLRAKLLPVRFEPIRSKRETLDNTCVDAMIGSCTAAEYQQSLYFFLPCVMEYANDDLAMVITRHTICI